MVKVVLSFPGASVKLMALTVVVASAVRPAAAAIVAFAAAAGSLV